MEEILALEAISTVDMSMDVEDGGKRHGVADSKGYLSDCEIISNSQVKKRPRLSGTVLTDSGCDGDLHDEISVEKSNNNTDDMNISQDKDYSEISETSKCLLIQ